MTRGFPGGSDGKESAYYGGRPGFKLWAGKIPWRRPGQPTPVFLPGQSHGQRSPRATVHGSQWVRHNWVTSTFTLILIIVKKEFVGPGLHLRPVCADRAWPPLQWTLNSVLSACGNDNGRIRSALGRGILKKRKQTLITPASGQCLSEWNHRLIGY